MPAALACLDDAFEACTHLRFPLGHRRAVRTTNLLERLFGEARRRTKVIPHAFGERAVLKLVYDALIRAAEAMLIARGLTFRQIGEELGGHPGYWGQLTRWSPLFQECVEHYRQILENARNRALEVQRAENVRRRRRRTRAVTPFVAGIIVERAARAERLRQAKDQVRQLKVENAKLARQLKKGSRRPPSQPPARPRSAGGLFAGGPLGRSYGRR